MESLLPIDFLEGRKTLRSESMKRLNEDSVPLGFESSKKEFTLPDPFEEEGEATKEPLKGAEVEPEVRVEYETGDIYVGTLVNGRRHGKGTMTFANGACISGNWNDDILSFQGIQFPPEGKTLTVKNIDWIQ